MLDFSIIARSYVLLSIPFCAVTVIGTIVSFPDLFSVASTVPTFVTSPAFIPSVIFAKSSVDFATISYEDNSLSTFISYLPFIEL